MKIDKKQLIKEIKNIFNASDESVLALIERLKQPSGKATVYICSPYRADTKEQLKKHIKYAKKLSKKWVLKGYSVITPHLYYTNFLDDNDPKQRDMGLASARDLILKCDFVVVGLKYGMSDGMGAELNFANNHNIPTYIVITKQDIKDFQD